MQVVFQIGMLSLLATLMTLAQGKPVRAQGDASIRQHFVEPGDTWTALAWRYQVDPGSLQETNRRMNKFRQPVIGTLINVPGANEERAGRIVTSNDGGLLHLAAANGLNPWTIAALNGRDTPYYPILYDSIFISGGSLPPRQLPAGFESLELSHHAARPGEAIAFRAISNRPNQVEAFLSELPFTVFRRDQHLIGLTATGAFYPAGENEFRILPGNGPAWSQPWQMNAGDWTFESITLTGEAAAIDQEAIRLERERLNQVWQEAGDTPLWNSAFQQPITDYLSISSLYGARRSYNGGPFRTYHEGVDFSAAAGTPVYASAAGTVAVAERLFVRGGAVIIDHGFGVFTGTYHLSEVLVDSGQSVAAGQLVGRVGSTGLSTGNHLHWDLLVGGTWVDASAWLEQDLACWILDGWGTGCQQPEPT